MRKYSLLLMLALFASGAVSAQLVNQGGTITIQPGATLVVQSDITNTTGSIVNNGTIEVTGNFTNDASVTSGAASRVIFKGDSDSNFKSNGAAFAIVENEKTAGDVVLTDAASATEAVNFTGTSNIKLGDFDFTLGNAINMTNGSGTTGFFETDGMGSVVKKTDAAGTFEFDLGTGSDFTPVEAVHTGTYVAGTSQVSAQVTDGAHPDLLADADDYLTRYWTVENNISNPSIDMTGTYAATGDVVGTETDMVGARWESMEWEFIGGAQAGSTVSATTTEATTEMTGMNRFGKGDFTVFLQAPKNSGSGGLMSTFINSELPLQSPYDASITAISIPVNAVDWIQVELRESSDLTSAISSVSGFLLNDGSIVDYNNSPLLLKDASSTTHVVVNHRYHLGIMSLNAIDMTSTIPAVNFSDGSVASFGTDAMINLGNVGSPIFAMYSGDFDNNGTVNTSDLINGWLPNNSQTYNYLTTGTSDWDLNGAINTSDLINIWLPNNSKTTQIPE